MNVRKCSSGRNIIIQIFPLVHRDFFLKNPRLGMLVRTFDKMPDEKQKLHLNNAEQFLASL